jgi:hypothetical protein
MALGRFSSFGRKSETAASAHEGLSNRLTKDLIKDSASLLENAKNMDENASFGSVRFQTPAPITMLSQHRVIQFRKIDRLFYLFVARRNLVSTTLQELASWFTRQVRF